MLFGLGLPPLMLTAVEFFLLRCRRLNRRDCRRRHLLRHWWRLWSQAGRRGRRVVCLREKLRRARRDFLAAARLGATGPGVAESAMKVELLAFEED